ncbi:hypothetical protein DSL64_11930 [Dyadobacter luteus]|uniref:Lipoprotein n=1 Tax=Dyadobacter luteus TaxID=2259619 RepID=A0A3D8YC15_9BACT|nr:hypothetical protein [Dyadobacter luteus]REA61664.1 hypothetical protein DSL64_11930 [Dyadobacter luteus]
MKRIRPSLFILFFVFVSQGCLLDFGNDKFTSFSLYLYNNSSKSGCLADSVDVIFTVKNVSKADSEEVWVSVPSRDQKNAQIEGTKDEFISVRVLKAVDSTFILEQRIAIKKNLYEGGDLRTRQLSYCDNNALVLSGFTK